jgi:DNA-binding response OmpR family regulator
MKLLVLDRGRVLFHLVKRLVPDDVDVDYTPSFREALRRVESHGTDVVIAEMGHGSLPWADFQQACCREEPHIPVLFQSAEDVGTDEPCLENLCSCNRLISVPYHAEELRAKVLEVLEEARRHALEAERTSGFEVH